MTIEIHAVTVDCHDAPALARFWAGVLSGEVRDAGNGYVAVDHGPGGSRHLLFQPVPEGAPGKNRWHLDLNATDPAAEVERLAGLGATVVERREDSKFTWWVLTDPEGNVFCVG